LPGCGVARVEQESALVPEGGPARLIFAKKSVPEIKQQVGGQRLIFFNNGLKSRPGGWPVAFLKGGHAPLVIFRGGMGGPGEQGEEQAGKDGENLGHAADEVTGGESAGVAGAD
jgi:hypothetical protein